VGRFTPSDVLAHVGGGLDSDGFRFQPLSQRAHSIRFDVGEYDATRELVIDPVIVFSTYLGGRSNDSIYDTAVDAAGSTYVTGTSDSPDFPVTRVIQPAKRERPMRSSRNSIATARSCTPRISAALRHRHGDRCRSHRCRLYRRDHFNSSLPTTIRVQRREDGISVDQIVLAREDHTAVPCTTSTSTPRRTQTSRIDFGFAERPRASIDQIVLSPVNYAGVAPGAMKNDATILSK
jgi:hypothetical protein